MPGSIIGERQAATGEKTVGMDGYLLAMGEPARDMVPSDVAITNKIDNPEQAINVGASWGIRFLTPKDTNRALPRYPGFGVDEPHRVTDPEIEKKRLS